MCWQAKSAPRGGSDRPLLYYITDRRQFAGDEQQQCAKLRQRIAECAAAGVDYIQLREKGLSLRELERLAREAVAAIPAGSNARLLINSRADIALACGAQGVHLPADSISAAEVRAIWMKVSPSGTTPVIGVSAHSLQEVLSAEAHGADFVVFGPMFEKQGRSNPTGLEELRKVCSQAAIPVLALGGVTAENARLCLEAGAAGIAGIRLFQLGEADEAARKVRGSNPK